MRHQLRDLWEHAARVTKVPDLATDPARIDFYNTVQQLLGVWCESTTLPDIMHEAPTAPGGEETAGALHDTWSTDDQDDDASQPEPNRGAGPTLRDVSAAELYLGEHIMRHPCDHGDGQMFYV
jgi:hypothetical protein